MFDKSRKNEESKRKGPFKGPFLIFAPCVQTDFEALEGASFSIFQCYIKIAGLIAYRHFFASRT